MSNKELEEKIKELITHEDIIVYGVHQVNHSPHPYTVGLRHIREANKNSGIGVIDKNLCRRVRCAVPNCNIPYDEHFSDTACFLQFKKDIKIEVLRSQLKIVVDYFGKNSKELSGFSFIEGEGKIIE